MKKDTSKDAKQAKGPANEAQPDEVPSDEAQPAEFPTIDELLAGPNYNQAGLLVTDPDPAMQYYWASPSKDPDDPQGVAACESKGYRVSSKKHNSRDCILMEQPKELYEARMAHEREQQKEIEEAMATPRIPKGGSPGDLRRLSRTGGLEG